MRAAVDRLAIPHDAADFHTVSISVGVATRIPDRTTTPDVLVQASRIALNAAKRAGRNRVSLLERIEGEG
jgi:PleD family two-component response regulator